MTKTEYRQYISSPEWQQHRKGYLLTHNRCGKCNIPRWIAIIAYDQDLNVHHRSYANLGSEQDQDLEPLCRRCHEIETFSKSALREIPKSTCLLCGNSEYFDFYSEVCPECAAATAWDIGYSLGMRESQAVAPLPEIGVADFTPTIHEP